MRTTRWFLLMLVALAATAAGAQSLYSDFYVIPVASHTPGRNGTTWMSDVALLNLQNAPLDVQMVLIESGEGNADNVFPVTPSGNASVTVPPSGSLLLQDVLNGFRSTGVTGAILVGADRPFAVTSRSYSSSPSGNTIGQTVTPVRDFLENVAGRSDQSAVAYIPGLQNNARYRSNLGFVAGNTNSASGSVGVLVTVRNNAGGPIGSRLFTVPAGNFEHMQFPVSSIIGNESQFDIGSAEFRITGGNGAVVPYGSVVDNATADAAFISGQFPANAPLSSGKSTAANPLRELFDRMRR